jgi:hypothetical protein
MASCCAVKAGTRPHKVDPPNRRAAMIGDTTVLRDIGRSVAKRLVIWSLNEPQSKDVRFNPRESIDDKRCLYVTEYERIVAQENRVARVGSAQPAWLA